MYKRLLALLLFIPMFLIAWYARNNRLSSASPPDTHITSDQEGNRYPSDRSSRGDRRQDEGRTRNNNRDEKPSDDRDDHHRSRRHGNEQASNQPGLFDFYLLNLSWSPEFCAAHPDKPECAAHPGFVLHGLWPQNNDGSYPEHCSDAPAPSDPTPFRDLYPDASLLRHEWSMHGTCSGLAPDDFFAKARTAMRKFTIPPPLEGLDHEVALAPDAIRTSFAQANLMPTESIVVSCGNNYLTAVEVCLDKNLSPVACSNVRSCRANSVRVEPPGKVNR